MTLQLLLLALQLLLAQQDVATAAAGATGRCNCPQPLLLLVLSCNWSGWRNWTMQLVLVLQGAAIAAGCRRNRTLQLLLALRDCRMLQLLLAAAIGTGRCNCCCCCCGLRNRTLQLQDAATADASATESCCCSCCCRNRTLQLLLLLLAQQDAATAGHCRTLSLLLPAQQDAAAAAASVIGRYNYCVTGRCNCQRWWMLQLAAIGKCWRNRTLHATLAQQDAATTAAAIATGRCNWLQLLLLQQDLQLEFAAGRCNCCC